MQVLPAVIHELAHPTEKHHTSHNTSPAASDLPQRGQQTPPSGKLRTLQTTLRLIPSSLNLYICGSQLTQFFIVPIINYYELVTKTKQTKAHFVNIHLNYWGYPNRGSAFSHTSLGSVGIEKTRGVCLLDKSATFSFFNSFTFTLKSTSKMEYFPWSSLSFYECQEAARHGGIFLQSQLSGGWGRKRLGQPGLHSKTVTRKKKKLDWHSGKRVFKCSLATVVIHQSIHHQSNFSQLTWCK